MKIIINYSPPGSTSKVYKTELTSSNPKETWAQLTQRYIEHSSLHPPQLLSLLKSLNHGNSAKNKYKLRYGNGYATNCHITWNASSRGSADGEDDEMIEANITLKPLTGSPLANTSLGKVSDISMLVIADSVPTKVKSAALDISVELVGLPNPNSAIKMTQAPFPIDMEKVNVLDIVEHGKFEGVVDQYSLKTFNESGQVGGGVGAAAPMSSGKKRKESSAGASATTSTTTKKASAAATAATSTKKKEKNKDKTSATTSSKKQKTAKDNTNDTNDVSAETTPKKSTTTAVEETTEKKKSKKKKKKPSNNKEEDSKAGPTGTVKKSRKSSDGKAEEDKANPVAESSPPTKSSKKKRKKSKVKNNNEVEDEANPVDECEPPKKRGKTVQDSTDNTNKLRRKKERQTIEEEMGTVNLKSREVFSDQLKKQTHKRLAANRKDHSVHQPTALYILASDEKNENVHFRKNKPGCVRVKTISNSILT